MPPSRVPSIHSPNHLEQLYLVLIKFDFYFLVGFIIQYNLVDVHFQEPEYSLTMALIPAALLLMTLGAYFIRREYRSLTIVTAVSPSAPRQSQRSPTDKSRSFV